MHLLARIWTTVTTVTHYFFFFPIGEDGVVQQPLGSNTHLEQNNLYHQVAPPLFQPPGSNINGFTCDYSRMGSDWVSCGSANKSCWLFNQRTNATFDIGTDYEAVAPIGIVRNYTLVVTDAVINTDGYNFTNAKLINGTMPGPLLEACWGDILNLTVINKLGLNGTSFHWHGIRQNQTMHMDGVNGITQCPIAPGDSFNYVWNATQYGSSWYHSHYSVQYADGVQAPITIHGPTSANYDDPVYPIIISDWLHNSAFEAEFTNPLMPTLLMNGTGNVTRFYGIPPAPGLKIPKGFEMVFNATAPNPQNGARRYLLRVINTSYASQLTFSIDNHYLTVVEADFVPVQPTVNVTSALVAIGQRYHFIVEAKPYGGPLNPIPADGNFWIRTNQSGCFDDVTGNVTGFERTGILRYNAATTNEPKSFPWPNIPANCTDILTTRLQTSYNWTVTTPTTGPVNGPGGELFAITPNFTATLQYALAHWSLQKPANKQVNGMIPFQTDYGNPTFLNLDNNKDTWPVGWVVVPENYTSKDYVFLVIQGGGHPIHLHGHDFAILNYTANAVFDPRTLVNTYSKPIRRDVILTPPNGFVLIAFKTDNPGTWLMHCHIAFHASSGLSLQILERQADANVIWPPGNSSALSRAQNLCANWNSWQYDCRNFWPGRLPNGTYPSCDDATMLQNDSGV